MIKIPGLLLIGGNSRHIGKTTLACLIINRFSAGVPIIAAKLTSIYPGDAKHHGHVINIGKEFEIIHEPDPSGSKDTAKMQKSGAVSAYYIQANDESVEKAWNVFIQMIQPGHMIVCESRSLRRFIEPGLFVYLKNSAVKTVKPYSTWLEDKANLLLVDPDREQLVNVTKQITLVNREWRVVNA